MRFMFMKKSDGTWSVRWMNVLLVTTLTYTLAIGMAEAFWFALTGGVSLLIGGFAFIGATLIAIRIVGTTLADPYRLSDPAFRSS